MLNKSIPLENIILVSLLYRLQQWLSFKLVILHGKYLCNIDKKCNNSSVAKHVTLLQVLPDFLHIT